PTMPCDQTFLCVGPFTYLSSPSLLAISICQARARESGSPDWFSCSSCAASSLNPESASGWFRLPCFGFSLIAGCEFSLVYGSHPSCPRFGGRALLNCLSSRSHGYG